MLNSVSMKGLFSKSYINLPLAQNENTVNKVNYRSLHAFFEMKVTYSFG